jgi:pyrroloquinoline quinone biosynthesis protein B
MFRIISLIIVNALVSACISNHYKKAKQFNNSLSTDTSQVTLVILGNVQDAGSPHIACQKECCRELFYKPDKTRKVVSLGLIDSQNKQKFLFEATPDISEQVKILKNYCNWETNELPQGIFLTHAHIGHYAGLMYLGKEAIDAQNIEVFAMPKMKNFLETNGPWSQLVNRKNIIIKELANETPIKLTPKVEVIPFTVPHRDEYSETVGYKIIGSRKKALFIPDIDKWEKWQKNIVEEIQKVDYALIDATFYSNEELNYRDVSQVPHPFVLESMSKFSNLPLSEKNKVIFIHFNHTNPLLNPQSLESQAVIKQGFRIARLGQVLDL